MKTEDDTYRVLIRPARRDMNKLCENWCNDYSDIRSWGQVLLDNNWTLEEWYPEDGNVDNV